jgi:hydrogenase maturation factor
LLISVPAGESAKMAAELKAAGLQAAEIGEVVENGKPLLWIE